MISETAMMGVGKLCGFSGGVLGVMAAFSLNEHPGTLETIAAGGLGASLSVILVRWVLSQYNQAITRLAKIEDERVVMTRETVRAMTEITDRVASLVVASEHRGEEVRELIVLLRERPCIAKRHDP